MFEFFKRWVSPTQTVPKNDVVFWVDLPEIAEPPPAPEIASHLQSGPLPVPVSNKRLHEVPLASHRERLFAMRVEHLKLCPPARCRELAAAGVETAGDLVFGDLKKITSAFGNPARAERAIRRYRAAIQLAAAIDSMMPRDALLLVAVHRRSVASLARDSAAQLHRDLERFSLSSRGSKLVGRRGIPSQRRVRSWIATCRELAATPPPEKRCTSVLPV